MDIREARAIIAERAQGPLPPEVDWTPSRKGIALRMIHVLANTPPSEWRTKREIHAALAEFRDYR